LCVAIGTDVFHFVEEFFEVALFRVGQVGYFEWGVVGGERENFVLH